MKLVVMITSQIERGLDVALAWKEAGAPGVTLLRSYGLHTLQQQAERQIELPRMVISMASAMASIIDNAEEQGHVILSLVEDSMVDKLITESNRVMGDMTQPYHGILFVLAVDQSIGVYDHRGSGA